MVLILSLQVFKLSVTEQSLQESKHIVAQQAKQVSELKAELAAFHEADQVSISIIIDINIIIIRVIVTAVNLLKMCICP